MKINYYFKSILASFTLLAALSCSEGGDVNNPQGETKASFEVSISGDLNESLVADVKVENYNDTYLIGMVSEAMYESEMSSSAEDYAYYLIDFAQASGSKLEKADNEYVFKGDAQSNLKATWEPAYDTKYYVAVFGVDKEGVISTEITMKEYTTQAAPVSPFTLSVIGTDPRDISLEVEVSDDYKGNYIVGPVTKNFFENSLASKESLLSGIILSYVSEKTEGSYELSTGYAYNGSQSIDIDELWELEPNTEYVIAAFGFKEYDDNSDAGTIIVADDLTVQTVELTTAEVILPSMGIAASGDADESGFSIEVTKAEEIEYFYIAVMTDNDFGAQYSDDASEAAAGFIDESYSGVEVDDLASLVGVAPIFTEAGVIDLHDYYYSLTPETPYTILAFGIDESFNITSSVGECHIATADAPKIDASFDIKIAGDEVSAESFILNVEPSADNFNYLVCAYEKAIFDPLNGWCVDPSTLAPDYALAAQTWIDDLSGWYEPVGDGENPVLIDMTTANGKTIFKGDASNIDIAYARPTALKASTEYVILAFGISPRGVIITDITTMDVETAAPAQSSASFTFEVVEDMSFIEYMGYTGKIKITPSDPGQKFFASVTTATMVDGLTDQEIFDNNSFTMIAPHMTHTGEYIYEYYIYEDSYLVVCGYDGGRTTPISKYEIKITE